MRLKKQREWISVIAGLIVSVSVVQAKPSQEELQIVSIADALQAKSQSEKALQGLNEYLKAHPKSSHVLSHRVYQEHLMTRYDAVISDAGRYLAQPDRADDEIMYRLRGYAYYMKGDNKRALADYDRATLLKPNYGQLYKLRADVLARMGQHKEALVLASKADRLEPHNAWHLLTKANLERQLGQDEAAVQSYIEYVRAPGSDFGIATAYAHQIWEQPKKTKLALFFIDSLLQMHPSDFNLLEMKGYALARMKRNNEAMAEFVKLEKAGRPSSRIVASLSMDAGNYGKALQAFNRLIVENPREQGLRSERAMAYYRMHEYEPALDDFRAEDMAVKANKAKLLARAECYMRTGKHDLAEQDYALAVRKFDEPYVHSAYANCLWSLSKYKEAAAQFTLLLKANPLAAGPLAERADCYRHMKMYEQAIADCNSVIVLDKRNKLVFICRGMCNSALNRHQKALTDFNVALGTKGLEGRVYAERAKVYDKLGQPALAAQDREKAKEYADKLEADFFPK